MQIQILNPLVAGGALFLAMGYFLSETLGMYLQSAVIILSGLWILFSVSLFLPQANKVEIQNWQTGLSQNLEFILSSVWLFFVLCILSGFQKLGMTNEFGIPFKVTLILGSLFLSFGALLKKYSIIGTKSEPMLFRRFYSHLWLIPILVLFTMKAYCIAYTPAPYIDVFANATAAVNYFFKGLNPYSQAYTDIYNGYYPYPPTFVYWPLVLYVQSISKWLLGDIRYFYILFDLGNCILLYLIMTRLMVRDRIKKLILLIWLSFPPTYYILINSWVDTYVIFFTTLAVWALLENRWKTFAVSIGLCCTVKQNSFLLALLGAVECWKYLGKPGLIQFTSILMVLSLGIVGPFVIDDAWGFYYSTIHALTAYGVRTDLLSLPALYADLFRSPMSPFGMMLGVLFSISSGIFLVVRLKFENRVSSTGKSQTLLATKQATRTQTWIGASSLCYGGLFFFTLASCNYHYFLIDLVFLYLIFQIGLIDQQGSGLSRN